MPRGDAMTPELMAYEPSAATIAPLSVHKIAGGIRRLIPNFLALSSASIRRREFAATPPAITSRLIPVSSHARNAFERSTSTTASWKDAATSAR